MLPHSKNARTSVQNLKDLASSLQKSAAEDGTKLSRSAALEQVARQHGFRDWNAACAAASATSSVTSHAAPLWMDVSAPLPRLSFKSAHMIMGEGRAIIEIMRLAEQFDFIADNVAYEARFRAIELAASDRPYVFQEEVLPTGDVLYRLCDRGYDPIGEIALDLDQFKESGAYSWNQQRGVHPGNQHSVIHDEILADPTELNLKSAARLLAGIALAAEKALEPRWPTYLTTLSPVDFKIDLNDPEQFTESGVARLLASRSGEEHCQLRVSKDGIAYLSDQIGSNALEGVAFRMETWVGGNGYAGLEASRDARYVRSIYRQLKDNWPQLKGDQYVDW